MKSRINTIAGALALLAASTQWSSAAVLFTTDVNQGATPLSAGDPYTTGQIIDDTSIVATSWLSSLGVLFFNNTSPATSPAVVSADGTGLSGAAPNFYEPALTYGARSGRFDYNIGTAEPGEEFTLTSAEIEVTGASVDLEWGVGYRLADGTTIRIISGGTISSAGTYSVDLTSLDNLLFTDSSSPLDTTGPDFRLLLADGASGTSGSVESFTVNAIPEPSAFALFAGVAAFLGVLRRRRRA